MSFTSMITGSFFKVTGIISSPVLRALDYTVSNSWKHYIAIAVSPMIGGISGTNMYRGGGCLLGRAMYGILNLSLAFIQYLLIRWYVGGSSIWIAVDVLQTLVLLMVSIYLYSGKKK